MCKRDLIITAIKGHAKGLQLWFLINGIYVNYTEN